MKSTINTTHCRHLTIAGLIFQLFFFCGLNAQSHAEKDSITFTFKSREQTWVVPEGVTKIHVDAYGAQGGSADKGGKGGKVMSDMKVTPGEKLIIRIGSQPKDSLAGYNGGGKGCGDGFGGGGATDIRINGDGLPNRVLVAGGGGGLGYGGFGGFGGGLIGGQGEYVSNDTNLYIHYAKGGTQDAGGAGAPGYHSAPGALGVGGDGIGPNHVCLNKAMGGGGGGYYGGGGSGAGGGGGGSSYTSDINQNVKHEQGIWSGNGLLIIYWEKPKK